MKLDHFALSSLMLILFSSCATYWSGSFSSNLAITPDQYRVIELASGEAKTYLFLGFFGGNSHDNLVLEAKNNLIKNYPLDSNMIFANWSVSFKNQWHIFGFTQICDVRAEIIGLKPGVNYTQKPFIMKTRKVVPLTRPLMKGDSVSFLENGERLHGIVLKESATTVKIYYIQKNNEFQTNRFKKDIQYLKPRTN